MHPKVKQYLIHCYLYYKLDSSVISDAEFDSLCKDLLDSGVEHPLVSKEDLEAGTGYSITNYPEDIIDEAEKLLRDTPETPSHGPERTLDPTDMSTYMLLGFYIDHGYAKLRDKQQLLQEEIKKRWDAGIDREIFELYFKDHYERPERFGL